MGAKTGTSTYGTEINQQYNLPDNAAKTFGLMVSHLNTQCLSGWASVKLKKVALTHS